MYSMFYNCSNLTVNLSGWKTKTSNYCGFNYNAPGVTPPSSFGETASYDEITRQMG